MNQQPGETNPGPAALFGVTQYSTSWDGDGATKPDPFQIVTDFPVGMGNAFAVQVWANFLAPTLITHIRRVDLSFEWSLANARTISSSGAFPNVHWVPMEKVSVRDERYPEAHRVELRWRVYSVPNPRDPAQRHPFDSAVLMYRWPAFTEVALGDNLSIYALLVSGDRDQAALFRVGESLQVAITPGGFARS